MKYGIGFIIACMVPVMAGQQIRERFYSTAKFDEDGSAQSRFTSWKIGWKKPKASWTGTNWPV